MIDPNISRIVPLFWDEIEQALGPIFQPIVGPLFDVLRDDNFRLFMLTSIVSICVFFVVIAYVAYELPVVIRWISNGSASLNVAASPNRVPVTPQTTSTRYKSESVSGKRERIAKASAVEVVGEVKVISTLEKKRDVSELTVSVTNMSSHPIEMVVVDLYCPEGIDFMTGSFRMQRIGTIPKGESAAAHFNLKQNYGSFSDISGMVEFMSSSYEISNVDIPSPNID